MNTLSKIVFITSCASSIAFARKDPLTRIQGYELTSEQDSFSYCIGQDIGKSLEPFRDEVDLNFIVSGIVDHLQADFTKIDTATASILKAAIFDRISEEKSAKKEMNAGKHKEAEEKFLNENKERKGVITTESGVQYEVIVQGEGELPSATSSVKVHYKGTHIDGKEFDSSTARDKPVSFRVDRVIKGWTEVLLLMPVGSKYKAYIPSELAYGTRGAGPIEPNEMIIFDIELIEVTD